MSRCWWLLPVPGARDRPTIVVLVQHGEAGLMTAAAQVGLVGEHQRQQVPCQKTSHLPRIACSIRNDMGMDDGAGSSLYVSGK